MTRPLPPWILAALLVAGALAGCRSRAPLDELYRDALEELAGAKGVSGRSRSRNERRYDEVRERLAADAVVSAEDHFFAAGVLSTSDSVPDLELARELAARAADLGEALGRVLVAETTDKILVRQGSRQRYGTQLYLDPNHKRWHLYPTDPLTGDEERREMGLPSLAELERLAEERNALAGEADAVWEAVGSGE